MDGTVVGTQLLHKKLILEKPNLKEVSMENKLIKLLVQFYALDHRGKFQFCKESEEACSWVNASSTREIDC